MKRIVLAALAMLVAVSLYAPVVLAGSDSGPKVALHLTAKPAKASFICADNSPTTTLTPCSNFVVTGLAKPDIVVNQLIYLVVAQVDTPYASSNSVAGLTCGIEYNGNTGVGVDMVSWTMCADLEFPNAGPRGAWPASGGGNVITFDAQANCQTKQLGGDGVHAVFGAFTVYAYGSDTFRVTPNRNFQGPDVLLVADCSSVQTELDTTGASHSGVRPTGWVGFATPGCNPCTQSCGFVDVKKTTWGKIKSTY